MTEKTKAILAGGFSQNDGYLTVYSFDPKTKEYTGEHEAHFAIGTGLPSNSTVYSPPENVSGKCRLFSEKERSWYYVDDFRDAFAYSKSEGTFYKVAEIGPLPETHTLKKPSSPFDKWDGEQWQKDEDAEIKNALAIAEDEKQALLSDIAAKISGEHWASKLSLGMLSDSGKRMFSAWINYAEEVKKTDISDVDNINYPVQPSDKEEDYNLEDKETKND